MNTLLVVLTLLFGQVIDEPRKNLAMDQTVDDHVRQVLQTLPPGSAIRRQLEEGGRGNGVHHYWMDDMRREGVRRVVISSVFVWDARPKKIRIVRILYYSKYDTDCAQITDPNHLELIRTSGLQQRLEDFAIKSTSESQWFSIDQVVQTNRGAATVELLDDEWLPHAPPLLGPLGEDHKPTLLDVLGNEASLADYLASGNITQEQLDQALMMASALYDDSCILRPLLKSGANPNTQDEREGSTPLMNAAGSGALNNVKTLLEAGAKTSTQDHAGRTALTLAERAGHTEIVQLLKGGSLMISVPRHL